MLEIGAMKGSISLSDAYGLGLIATRTKATNGQEIVRYLGPKAQKIGRAIITGRAASKSKNATKKFSGSKKK
jgi:hypothetical protein